METIYFIPGLAFDETVAEPLVDEGLSINTINWIEPIPDESIQSYAVRMANLLPKDTEITLMGHSFGGVLVQEISRLIKVKQLILISTCKSKAESSLTLKLLAPLRLNTVITKDLILKSFPLWANSYGYALEDEKQVFINMIERNTDTYLSWALRTISQWESDYTIEVPMIHIHGNKDRTFPISNIKNVDYVIDGGNHFMVYSKAREIAAILKKYLSD